MRHTHKPQSDSPHPPNTRVQRSKHEISSMSGQQSPQRVAMETTAVCYHYRQEELLAVATTQRWRIGKRANHKEVWGNTISMATTTGRKLLTNQPLQAVWGTK